MEGGIQRLTMHHRCVGTLVQAARAPGVAIGKILPLQKLGLPLSGDIGAPQPHSEKRASYLACPGPVFLFTILLWGFIQAKEESDALLFLCESFT